MKIFSRYALIFLLIFTTSCISFEKAETTKYDKRVKFEKKNSSFDVIIKSVRTMLSDPDYIYSKKNTSWSIDKFPKEVAERKTGIMNIDEKNFTVEGTGLIYVKFGLVPAKTLYDIKIVVLENEIILSFYNIANLGGNLYAKRDMNIFIEVADKMADRFLSEIK